LGHLQHGLDLRDAREFFADIDLAGFRRWTFPLVVGSNSIARDVMAPLLKPFVAGTLKIHLGWVWAALARSTIVDRLIDRVFGVPLGPQLFSGLSGPIYQSAAILFVLWLICL
jgi:hypothetical protein